MIEQMNTRAFERRLASVVNDLTVITECRQNQDGAWEFHSMVSNEDNEELINVGGTPDDISNFHRIAVDRVLHFGGFRERRRSQILREIKGANDRIEAARKEIARLENELSQWEEKP